MKLLITTPAFIALLLLGCKKNSTTTPPGPTPVTPAKNCQLIFWKGTETAYPTYFEYNSNGKLAKSRWFPNGILLPALTRIFEYNAQNQLVKIADSAGNMSISFSNYNTANYPLKAIYKFGNLKQSEFEFEYDSRNNISRKIIQLFDNSGNAYGIKDTMNFYYDANGNIVKETAITILSGIRREYILLEAEGYDNKPNFYKSIGNEFNYLYRYNRLGEGFLNLGDYIYSISVNNPGRVYLHNQGTDDANKGDYFTYTYEYDAATGYPSKISFTNTSGGIVRGPSLATANYNCK